MTVVYGEHEFDYRGIFISPVESSRFDLYLELFKSVFPSFRVNLEYLQWLYLNNPLGVFVGFDAIDSGKVVAHYACIPTRIESHSSLSLLALNTATDKAYQGRGLLKVLANATYSRYEKSFSNVVGVANAQAVGALTRHLSFRHLGNLDLRIGKLTTGYSGRRLYSLQDLEWRARNPISPLRFSLSGENFATTAVNPLGPLIPVRNVVPTMNDSKVSCHEKAPLRFGITLDWRRDAKPLVYLPARFKPSPLSLVYRPLLEDKSEDLQCWSLPDFDAF